MQFHITIIIFKFKIIENMISGKQWHIFSPLSTVGLQKDYKNARIPWSSSCRLQRAWRRSIKTTWNRHQNMSRFNAIHWPSSIHAKDTEKVKKMIFLQDLQDTEEICHRLICTIKHLKNKHQRMTNEIKILMKTNELLTQHIEELEGIISPS